MEPWKLGKYLAVTLVLLPILGGCIAPVSVPVADAAVQTEAESPGVAAGAAEAATEMAAMEVSVPFEAIQVINDFAPGAWTPPHSHGGLVLLTVLEGEITVRDEETGAETIYGPGEALIEQIGDVLAVGNDGEEKARVAIIFLLPEGASLTTTEEGTDTASLPPGPTPVYRSSMPVSEDLGRFEAIQAINDFTPGAWTPPHWHGGPALVTVLAGEITARNDETREETIYGPGEALYEPTGHMWAVGNDGEEDARVAVIFLLPEGASLTTLKEGTDTDSLPPGPSPVYRSSMLATTLAE